MVDNRKNAICVGSRGSELALAQAQEVCRLLQQAHPGLSVQRKVISTKGDQILDQPLVQIGDKGLFTREIEQALLDKSIDLAVHSLKDLPTVSPDGLEIACIPTRQDSADVLILNVPELSSEISPSNVLEQLAPGATILTGSLRRAAQLLNLRADLKIQNIRGNVPTRLGKLSTSGAAGLFLAAAGMNRLGITPPHLVRLDPEGFLPACGQGALALQIRQDDEMLREIVAAIHDPETAETVTAERAFLAELEGGCQVPIGATASCSNNQVKLTGMIASLDGSQLVRGAHQGMREKAAQVGRELAGQLLERGGRAILEQIRSNTDQSVSN